MYWKAAQKNFATQQEAFAAVQSALMALRYIHPEIDPQTADMSELASALAETGKIPAGVDPERFAAMVLFYVKNQDEISTVASNWWGFAKTAIRQMPLPEALQTLGLASMPSSMAEITKHRQQLLMQRNKATKGGDVGNDFAGTSAINNAFDAIKAYFAQGGSQNNYRSAPQNNKPRHQPSYTSESGTPPWQTDQRSSYNRVSDTPAPEAWRDINRVKKDIYEMSLKRGGNPRPMTLVAFDGHFMRSSATVMCNPETMDYAGEVMEYWNSKGGNPYPTEAVFEQSGKSLLCIRLHGRPVKIMVPLQSESFNNNVANDENFMRNLRTWVANH